MNLNCRKRVLLTLLLAVATSLSFAQNIAELDSLSLRLRNAKHDTTKIEILLEISESHRKSNYVKALDFAQQAKVLANEKGYPKFEAKANTAIGSIAIDQGDYKKASTYYFNVLKYAEESNDFASQLSANNNLGTNYDRIGNYDKALEHYFKAQEILNAHPSIDKKKHILPSIYNNIANIYQSKGDPKAALKNYEKGLELALQAPLHRVRGQLYNNIGKLYMLDLNDQQKAIEYLQKGLAVREELGEQNEIARSLVFLCGYYIMQYDYTKAREVADKALMISKATGSLDIQKMTYNHLTQIEEAVGNFPKALEYQREFKNLSDSILEQQASSEITKLQLQYDFELLEKEREQEKQRTRIQYLLAIVILSVLLITAVLITVIIRSRARQSELKRRNLMQDVENKNKELTTNVMYLIRKNELLNNVAERLMAFESNLVPENRKAIQDIVLDLQREADTDSWKEFELRFNQVHSEFYKNLRKLYPGLSPAEEKLCAFLRLNMSSKEIAAITQQSTKSVEVARARLRKKLNLTNTNSNLVTHLSNL